MTGLELKDAILSRILRTNDVELLHKVLDLLAEIRLEDDWYDRFEQNLTATDRARMTESIEQASDPSQRVPHAEAIKKLRVAP